MINKENINIIYLSTSCSLNKFNELQQSGINRDVPQAQKYHRLLIEGLAANVRDKINAVTLIPTNRGWSKKIFFGTELESVGNVEYLYVPFINYPIIKHIVLFFYLLYKISALIKSKGENAVIICDIWNQILSAIARTMGMIHNVPVVGIVTDVPGHRSSAYKKSINHISLLLNNIVEKIAEKSVGRYDGYLLLTKRMNEIVNPLMKPSIVLEGHADVSMLHRNKIFNSEKPYVAVYAGTVHKEYAIPELVQAFLDGNYNNWELHIFGNGNYAEELKSKIKSVKNVIFHGLVPNEEVVDFQLKADLIINPRPTGDDYVQYSFPSKTLEAMASGTPLLTTKLPGMPAEYIDYVYIMDDGYEGICKGLQSVLNMPVEELNKKGGLAKNFVIENKTNIKQAAKLVGFLAEIIKDK